MADIFISHSGNDSDVAAAIGERIRRERPSWSLFYDKDNMRAGQCWQDRLRDELQSCRMVVALLSRNWLASPWCFTEAVTASFRGKDVVTIEIEDLTSEDLAKAPPIMHERQRVRLRESDDRAFQELLEALDRSGLDPNGWFPIPDGVGPYPGLVAFDEKDAGVFFGRKQEITEYLSILDTLRGKDRAQVLVMSGASGSGKSSVLRAGLIPRLRRKPEWIVISPFEVAREPVRNLLDRLSEALTGLGILTQEFELIKPPSDARTLAQTLDEALRQLEKATGAWVLLPLDQAEALVAGTKPEGDPVTVLLEALTQVLSRRTRHVVLAITIRAEFVPRFEAVFAGSHVRLLQAPLSTIGSLAELIEKPADRLGIRLERGLSERIIEDVGTGDALPLLAYTLKALSDRCARDRRLTLDAYETLGGVQGAIAAKVALVLSDPEPTAEEYAALRRAFTRFLIRVDESAVEGERLLRRVVLRASLPQFADRLIGRLVDAGLLTTKKGTIELAHERMIGDWPKLPINAWLVQDAADRRLIYKLHPHLDEDTLPDGLLSQAEELLRRDPQLELDEPPIATLIQRSKDRRRLYEVERDRARMQLLAIQARRAFEEVSTPDRIELAAALALESIEIARKGKRPSEADALEACRLALDRLPLQVISQGSEVLSLGVLADGRLVSGGEDGQVRIWPRDNSDSINHSHGSPVRSLVTLPDGRTVSGGDDCLLKLWSKDKHKAPVVIPSIGRFECLVRLPDGRLATTGGRSGVKLFSLDSTGKPQIFWHNDANSLALLPDGRLASVGLFEIKIWSIDVEREPVVLKGGGMVIEALPDGRLACGGINGQIMVWPAGLAGEPRVLSHGAWITALAGLPDGRLASGAHDGLIKLWPRDGDGEPKTLAHGSTVRSLLVLPDGRLVSGGSDGQIKVWLGTSERQSMDLSHGEVAVFLSALSDGRLASASVDGQIKLWPQDGVSDPEILRHGVVPILELPDGRLVSGGDGGLIKLWVGGAVAPTVLRQGRKVASLAVRTDGTLASGSADGQIKIWPQKGGGEPLTLWHGSLVRSLVFLADGRLASGGEDGLIKLWLKDYSGEPVLQRHGSEVRSLVVLADGRLASGGEDGLIKLWPADIKGEPVIRRHGSRVMCLAVLTDGRLASGGADGQIKLWPREGEGEPAILRHGRLVSSLAVLSDGRLVSGDLFGQIKFWLLDEQKLVAAICLRAGRNLTKDEWIRYIGSEAPWQPSCRNHPSNWRTPDC